jgi:hypothetical protein
LLSKNDQKHDITATVNKNLLEFTLNFTYKLEALPLKELTVSINNSTRTYKTPCIDSSNQTDCMLAEDTWPIQHPMCLSNNIVDIFLAYNLNNYSNCSKGLTTLNFKHQLNVLCKSRHSFDY